MVLLRNFLLSLGGASNHLVPSPDKLIVLKHTVSPLIMLLLRPKPLREGNSLSVMLDIAPTRHGIA
jgi:hypothetical protein